MRRLHVSSLALLVCLASAGCNCGGESPGGEDPPPAQNQPPVPRIVAPADHASGGPEWDLSGEATDAEDGMLPSDALSWSSSLDGQLGAGAMLHVRLTPGAHTLRLHAVDSKGLRAQAEVAITVVSDNRPPVALIDAPAEGAQFDEGSVVELAGHATDPEDGELAGSALSWASDKIGALGNGKTVQITPAVGEHQVVLTAFDRQGLTGRASVTFTVLPAGANHSPVATISRPASGTVFAQGEKVVFEGAATDKEDGTIPAGSLAWSSDLDGALGTGSVLESSTLRRGAHTITLTATDSAGAPGTAVISLSVSSGGNQPPIAQIVAPEDGATFGKGVEVRFSGTGNDAEDGALTGTALKWTSSLDGELGTGATLASTTLASGLHRITLTATDSTGDQGAASVSVRVLNPNTAPVATISAPADGSTFLKGATVSLRGSATDSEEGALTGNSLSWHSSRGGFLGNGTELDTVSLAEGGHVITFTAIDSGGLSGQASIQLTIEPQPVNLAPIAQLAGPALFEAEQAIRFDGSASNDPDGTLTSYCFDFGDGTTRVCGTENATEHTFATEGSYTVTLEVTDDEGAKGTAELPVTVTPAIRRPKLVQDSDETLGVMCSLEITASGPAIAYMSLKHPALWYTWLEGTTWRAEQVDGLGYHVGGTMGDHLALVVDAEGKPHLAYSMNETEIWYATRTATGWVRELVGNDAVSGAQTGIALDPANGDRPTVAYTNASRSVLAYRTGPGAWTPSLVTFGQPATVTQRYLGGLSFDAGGAATLAVSSREQSGSTSILLGTWRAPSTTTGATVTEGAQGRAFVVAGATPYVLTSAGLYSDSGASWVQSNLETFGLSTYALTVDGQGHPWLASRHGTTLEVIHADAGGFWQYERHGSMDGADIDAAWDAKGARVCFFRDGNLMLF